MWDIPSMAEPACSRTLAKFLSPLRSFDLICGHGDNFVKLLQFYMDQQIGILTDALLHQSVGNSWGSPANMGG